MPISRDHLLPDYRDGSIVNLVSSILLGLGLDPPEPGYGTLAALPPQALEQARNIVVLIIDGLGYEYLHTHGAGGALQRHCVDRLTSVFPTTTASAVTSLFTGVAPQQHGVTGWFVHLKELGAVAAILPFRPRFGGASFSHHRVDPARVFDQGGVFERLGSGGFVVSPRRIAHSDYSLAMGGPAERRPYGDLEGCFEQMLGALGGSGRRYVYAYWADFDTLAHEHGVASAQVRAHFLELDQAFAAFLDAIRGTDTALIVTADHGFIDTPRDHVIDLVDHPRLADTLALPLCGEPRVAYCYVRPSRAARFEDYVHDDLARYCDVYPSERLVEEGWFGLHAPSRRFLDRIGDYVLVMRDDYIIKDFLPGESRFIPIGVHGGLSAGELYVPLIFARL